MKTSLFTGGFLAFLGRVPSTGSDGSAAETAPATDAGTVPFLPMLLQLLQPAPPKTTAVVTDRGSWTDGEASAPDTAGGETVTAPDGKEAEASLLRLALSRPRVMSAQEPEEQPTESDGGTEQVPMDAEGMMRESAGPSGAVPFTPPAPLIAPENSVPGTGVPLASSPAKARVSTAIALTPETGTPAGLPVQPVLARPEIQTASEQSVQVQETVIGGAVPLKPTVPAGPASAAPHQEAPVALPSPVKRSDPIPQLESVSEAAPRTETASRAVTPEHRTSPSAPDNARVNGRPDTEPRGNAVVPPMPPRTVTAERVEVAPRIPAGDVLPSSKLEPVLTAAPPDAGPHRPEMKDTVPHRDRAVHSSAPLRRNGEAMNRRHDPSDELPPLTTKADDVAPSGKMEPAVDQRQPVKQAEVEPRTPAAPVPDASGAERAGTVKEPVTAAPNAEKPSGEGSFGGQQERPADRERTFERTVAPASNDDRTAVPPAGTKEVARVTTTGARWEPETVRSMMHQIARGVVAAVDTDHSTMKVVLHPESLGEVTVKVLVDDGKVSATMDVQQSQVKSLIEANMPQLREALQQKGLTVERIEILAAEKGMTDEAGRRQQDRGQRRNRREDVDAPAGETAAKRFGYNTVEYTM